ncbi:hypothetical protein MTBBW1_2520009 [Desulfamplus magnetovallimortis]|uniref:Uncharacterized protein n=1 Tax=Desulfamplus magnetovallimortis TaxID=1246637 RepID=A0A1W1HET5_9BACT|nr:hypothetical protein MTBBW1_2520009 [Desulfamplus magnetovallimortis]
MNTLISANEEQLADKLEYFMQNLLKKFELSKHVHQFYTFSFKPDPPEAYTNIRLYLQLALIFDLYYSKYQIIQYLNGLIKCMDTLCSQYQRFSDEKDIKQFSFLISSEINYILTLSKKLGINFETQ